MENIGEFQMESGKMIVTDPCYEKGTWCQGVLDNVKNGKWEAFIETSGYIKNWGNRVSSLFVVSDGYKIKSDWEKQEFEVGVDSGQAGCFDEKYFPQKWFNDPAVSILSVYDNFYNKCCDITCSSKQAGCISFGAVSSSGYGDGVYTCCVEKEDGEIKAVWINYISKEDIKEEDIDESYREDEKVSSFEEDHIAEIKNLLDKLEKLIKKNEKLIKKYENKRTSIK
jgi:hypothetical protein